MQLFVLGDLGERTTTGLSGLATAFSLRRVGHNVTVLERAAEDTVVCAGPHTLKFSHLHMVDRRWM